MMATLSPPPTTIITTSNRRRFSSFEHLSGQEDFRLMYNSGSERKNGWTSTRSSISSFNTDDDDGAGSTSTEPISNTVRARERKQKEKRRFLSFTKVLMKFLEKKNPTVCKNARNVILKYNKSKKKNKKRGRNNNYHGEEDASEIISMCDSIKAPLKQIVGSAYWKQAKGYLKNQMEEQANNNNNENQSSNANFGNADFEPLSLLDSNTGYFSDTQVEALSHFASNINTSGINTSTYRRPGKRSCPCNDEERKLRKQRFWMLVRVLMRYIEKKDSALYMKARATLKDCARRNAMKEDRFTNLVECVQRELKQTVGRRYWKRAEYHVAKHLLKKANEKAYEDALLKEAAFFGSLDDFTPLPLEKQEEQPTDPCTIEGISVLPTCNKNDWRDPSIPTNVTIPANRGSAEDWASLASDSEYQFGQQAASTNISKDAEEANPTCTDALYECQDADLIEAAETNRKRRKLWCRPYPQFLNMR